MRASCKRAPIGARLSPRRRRAGSGLNSLSALGGGEGRGEVGVSGARGAAHLTFPSLRDGPLSSPP